MKLPFKVKMWALVNDRGEMLPMAYNSRLPRIKSERPAIYYGGKSSTGKDWTEYQPVRVEVTISKAGGAR